MLRVAWITILFVLRVYGASVVPAGVGGGGGGEEPPASRPPFEFSAEQRAGLLAESGVQHKPSTKKNYDTSYKSYVVRLFT